MSALEGAPCVVCNAGTLTRKVGTAQGQFAGQGYYVCTNWQFHNNHKEKGDPMKGPWILETDSEKVAAYLAKAAGEAPPKKAKAATGAAKPVAQIFNKPAAAQISADHVLITISAKVARMESLLEQLVEQSKNSTAAEPEEPAEDAD